ADHQSAGRLSGVQRLESRAAKKAAIDNRRPHQNPKTRGGINSTAPGAGSYGVEIFRMLAHQQGFCFPIAALLLEIRSDCGAPEMPNEGCRAETDFVACLLQPPANVGIITRLAEDRIEAADL